MRGFRVVELVFEKFCRARKGFEKVGEPLPQCYGLAAMMLGEACRSSSGVSVHGLE